jgi:hypothetical protein
LVTRRKMTLLLLPRQRYQQQQKERHDEYGVLNVLCLVWFLKILTMTEERKKLNDSDSYATITTAQTQCKHQQTVIWIGNLILCTECVFLYFHTGIVLKLLHYSMMSLVCATYSVWYDFIS